MAEEEQEGLAQESREPEKPEIEEGNPLDNLIAKWETHFEDESKALEGEPLEADSIEKPQHSIKPELIHIRLLKLLDQRNKQRDGIFKLAKSYCWISLLALIAIIAVQIAGRIAGPNLNFNVFSGNELEFYITGVFGQFVGLLYVITKALYNESDYKEIYRRILDM